MKTTIIMLLLLFSNTAYNQETNWKSEERMVLEEFGLSQNDGRGITFLVQNTFCSESFTSEKEAILAFLTDQVKHDIRTFCIEEVRYNTIEEGNIYDLHAIIQLYLHCKVD